MKDIKMNIDNHPQEKLIRLKTVLEMIPVSRSTWWAGVKEGKYPQPIHLGKKIRLWHQKDILVIIENLTRHHQEGAKNER